MSVPLFNPDEQRALEQMIAQSALVQTVHSFWSDIGLPDCWLVAGCIAQTVWNHRHGFAPDHGLRDIDIVYFDPCNLSAEREAENQQRVADLLAPLPVKVDVKNEARVHLWYEERFGYALTPYTSTQNAIATFPTTATSIGVQPTPSGLNICAPFGLSDLLSLVVRPNKTQIERQTYEDKVKRWRTLWPELIIVDW